MRINIFKNGKRAKSPFCQIEAIDKSEAKEQFLNEYLAEEGSKYEKYIWAFVRSDLSQDRSYEKNLEKEMEVVTRKNNFLGRLAIKAGSLPNNIMAGLLFTEETNWKWQWAVLENATNRYIKGVSPGFVGFLEAEKWMEEQINE